MQTLIYLRCCSRWCNQLLWLHYYWLRGIFICYSVLQHPALQGMWITKERWLELVPCITRSTPNQIWLKFGVYFSIGWEDTHNQSCLVFITHNFGLLHARFKELENSCDMLNVVTESSFGVFGTWVLWECFCTTFVISISFSKTLS